MARLGAIRSDQQSVLVRMPTRAHDGDAQGEGRPAEIRVTVPKGTVRVVLEQLLSSDAASGLASSMGFDLGGVGATMLLAKIPPTWTPIDLPDDLVPELQVIVEDRPDAVTSTAEDPHE